MPRKSSQRNKTQQRKAKQKELVAARRAEQMRNSGSAFARGAAHRHAEAQMVAAFASIFR